MLVGDGTIIEEGALVGAAAVGSYVHVGKRAIVVGAIAMGRGLRGCHDAAAAALVDGCFFASQGACCMLKDCCKIEDDAVVPPNTVVPSFAIFGGSPGAIPAILLTILC